MTKHKEYDNKLLKHFINPENTGVILHPDAYARIQNPVNGYTTDLYFTIDNNKITNAQFKTYGCTVTIAAGSAITKILKDTNINDLLERDNPSQYLKQQLTKELGNIPDKNWHCIPTIIKAVYSALQAYFTQQKNNQYIPTLTHLIESVDAETTKRLQKH